MPCLFVPIQLSSVHYAHRLRRLRCDIAVQVNVRDGQTYGTGTACCSKIPAHCKCRTAACQNPPAGAQAFPLMAFLCCVACLTTPLIMSHLFRNQRCPNPSGRCLLLPCMPPCVQVAVLKMMMRLCERWSAACLGSAWPCGLVPRHLSSGQKVSTTGQEKGSSSCVLVLSEAKRLSSLAEDGTARQVSLWVL